MGMALTLLQRGNFTSAGTSVKLDMPAGVDYMMVKNLTQSATTQTPGRGVEFEWWIGMADGAAMEKTKADGTNALQQESITSGGFTYRTARPDPEAAVTGTAITAASPPVVTAASHGYSNGDRVRLYGTTGMLQIAGMDFVVASAATNTFELEGQDFSGFAAAATALSARRLPALGEVEPSAHYVSAITQAASAVVTTTTAHDYVVNQVVYFSVPSGNGMVEMNSLSGKITAVSTYTITVDIDSQGFTAFALPASAASPVKFAMVASEGQRNSYDVDNVPFREGQFVPYMLLGAGIDGPAGSSSDEIEWLAFKSENGA